MRLPETLPPGFACCGSGRQRLLAPEVHVTALRQAGFDRPARWDGLIRQGSRGAGRGRVARWRAPSGEAWILKQLRRGGLLAPLWRDRFAGCRRPMRNLTLPLEAAAREIPTPQPRALLLAEGPLGFCRAWLALAEVAGVDLRTRFLSDSPPSPAALAQVMALVRRAHDRGLEHRDLNLGNLLVDDDGGRKRVYLLDLDRAELHPAPLDFGRRQRALRRLERSYVKTYEGPRGARGSTPAGERATDLRDRLYELYAAGDAELASRLARGRRVGRWLLRWHRLGW